MSKVEVTLSLDEIIDLALSEEKTPLETKLKELSDLDNEAGKRYDKAEDALIIAYEKLISNKYAQHIDYLRDCFGKKNVLIDFEVDSPPLYMNVNIRSSKVSGELNFELNISNKELHSMLEYKECNLAEKECENIHKESIKVRDQLRALKEKAKLIKPKLAAYIVERQTKDLFKIAKDLLANN